MYTKEQEVKDLCKKYGYEYVAGSVEGNEEFLHFVNNKKSFDLTVDLFFHYTISTTFEKNLIKNCVNESIFNEDTFKRKEMILELITSKHPENE